MTGIDPPSGAKTCIGFHEVIIPEAYEVTWGAASIDGQHIRILPSDGRPLRAQMDRHGMAQSLGQVWAENRFAEWNFAVFESADTGHPFRYEIGATQVAGTLVLTVGRHSKSRVADPSAIRPALDFRAIKAERHAGQPGGFCLDKVVLLGLAPQRSASVGLGFHDGGETAAGAARSGDIRLDYRYGDVGVFPDLGGGEIMPVLPPSEELPQGYEGLRNESRRIDWHGQPGFLSLVWENESDGAAAQAAVEGRLDDPARPGLSLEFRASTGTQDDLRKTVLALLAGVQTR